MKKIGIGILFFIVFLILYFLEANLFPLITIKGVLPNLIVIFILFIGLFANTTYGILFGAICGLILDLIYGKCVGISAVMLCVVGYLGSYFDKNFSKDSRATIMFMVLGATLIFEVINYVLNYMLNGMSTELINFIKILAIEIIYNLIIVIILYPMIQKFGYGIENVYKGNRILTRYF